MNVDELKQMLANPLLEGCNEIVAAFPCDDDEEYAPLLDCEIENQAGRRKAVLRFILPRPRLSGRR